MELRVLKYFLTVAAEGNITRAADILHVTQPTLSRQLKELEEEMERTFTDNTGTLKMAAVSAYAPDAAAIFCHAGKAWLFTADKY